MYVKKDIKILSYVYKCRHAFDIYIKCRNNTTKQDKSWIRKKN